MVWSMCRLNYKLLVLWSLWVARIMPQLTEELKLRSGFVRGAIAPDGSYISYTNIPYATVVQRFQAPGPAPTWNGTLHAINEHIKCQQPVGDILVMGQRDCLVLNVHTPLHINPGDRLPVMVFIHGGAFFHGSGSPVLYGPKYIVRKGIILITVNYRLSVPGFLCLRTKEIPGNAGMKDVVAALKWVRDNVKVFGGDPDNVTLFGESAGAATISYLILSPISKGLFQKAITQSGSSLAPWAYQYEPIHIAHLLARQMGYDTKDRHKLAKFLESKSDDELILTKIPREEGNIFTSDFIFTPCSEDVINGIEPFLIESPVDILSKGNFYKLPMIMGVNTDEGVFMIALDKREYIKAVAFEKALPNSLNITSERMRLQVAGQLKSFYITDDMSLSHEAKLSKLYGEPVLAHPTLEEIEWILKTSDQPIYGYIFNYSGWRNIPKMVTGYNQYFPETATHSDELFYLFSQPWLGSLFEDSFIDKMTTMWTNFAKYGDPTPEITKSIPMKWQPVNPSSPQALVIDKQFSTSPLYFTESLRYLREIFAKYRRK